MFELVIQNGKQQGHRLMLPRDKAITVGRDEGCQLTLQSSLVSRQHCELKHLAEGILVTDLGSQNGTYVNEVGVTAPTLMNTGDFLRIGACTFEVQPHRVSTPNDAGATKDTIISATSTTTASSDKAEPGKTKKQAIISDDDIADWLTDEETSTDLPSLASTEDTTIIRGRSSASTAESPAGGVPSKPPTPPAAAKSKSFRSVKEEAADIIRRHWAKVRGE